MVLILSLRTTQKEYNLFFLFHYPVALLFQINNSRLSKNKHIDVMGLEVRILSHSKLKTDIPQLPKEVAPIFLGKTTQERIGINF